MNWRIKQKRESKELTFAVIMSLFVLLIRELRGEKTISTLKGLQNKKKYKAG
jgi:hypothetical protein